jgi:hypothetical protein
MRAARSGARCWRPGLDAHFGPIEANASIASVVEAYTAASA